MHRCFDLGPLTIYQPSSFTNLGSYNGRAPNPWTRNHKGHFTLPWNWVPVTITLQALSLVEKEEPVQLHFTLHSRDQRSMWMQDGCKVYMDSYMALTRPCFMVIWIIFKNHLLEVSLTQNQETTALQTLKIIDLFEFIIVRTCMNRDSLK